MLGGWAALAGVAAAQPAEAISFELAYTADVMGVIDGGLAKRGRVLDNFDLLLDADLERLLRWRGASAHFHLLNNSGAMPNNDAGTLQGVNNIEVAGQHLRLFEAWIEQAFGAASVRFGLYDLNSEFYVNDSAGALIAPAFGIGSEIAATGPNGPSIFPSTAIAVRFGARFGENGYARAAFLNAAAGVPGDPHGVDTSFDEGALGIAEAGFEAEGKLAIGVWRYTRRQDDIRDLNGSGDPVQRIAQGAYVVYEQPLNDPGAARAATAFVRAGVSDGDTTPFSGGWQAGVLVRRVFEGRPDSLLSLGVNQGLLSEGYRRNRIDLGASMANAEMQAELTYSDRLSPHVTVQPDLQYIRRPGGERSIEDAVVAGVRVTIDL